MERLPITYYRLGQPIQIDAYPDKPAKIAEINTLSIGFFFGPDLNSAWRLQSVSPEFIKPILRPISQLKPEHIVEIYRREFPATTQSVDEILEYDADLRNWDQEPIMPWARSTNHLFWLADLGYDMQGLIGQNLAVAEAE